MIKVVIAEDEKRIREGLVGAVPWSDLGFEVAGSGPNGVVALDLVRRLVPQREPGLLITDIRMPKMDGLQLLKEARAASPKLRVFILSGYDEFAYAQRAITYGASEFLVKPVSEEDLVAALERARSAIREEDSVSLPAQLRTATEGDGRGGGSRFMRRIESYVERHYRRDLPVKEVADFVGLSPNYFSHLFKQERGMSFVDYLNAVRIAAACRLLEESGLKVYEIAEEVGFTDYKYFSTVFRKVTGESPTKYRPEAENIH
jgi:two-component system, response regulator YesN